MVKLTGGYIGNDIAPKNIRYIAGGGSPNKKKYKSPDSWRAQRKTNKKEVKRTAKKEKEERASGRKNKKA